MGIAAGVSGGLQEARSHDLPEPRRAGGMPLFTAVSLRQSGRVYSDRPLSDQTLSDLLWCAYGYVAHGERMPELAAADRRLYASVDAAFIGQNVYLYCAAQGLSTVFRGDLDPSRLAHALRLQAHEFVTFAQSVGHPADQ